jgi:hypothetical protein
MFPSKPSLPSGSFVAAVACALGVAAASAQELRPADNPRYKWELNNLGGADVVEPESHLPGFFRVRPREFVGRANECFPGSPAGSHFVTAQWMRGMGLPDNGQPNVNPADPRNNPAKNDPHFGLLLSKNGSTEDCSASGARITGTPARFTIVELGYDYRNGSHCGAGSPRFNAITPDGLIYFIGCAHGTKTPAPQAPTEWTRIRFRSEDVFPQFVTNPPFEFGVTEVARLTIVNDEGTDTPSAEQPSGVGLIVLDNFLLNGHTLTRP